MTSTRGLICDICNIEIHSRDDIGEGWSHINLGTKLIGYTNYQDICPSCTLWLIAVLQDRRKEFGV